LKEIKDQEGLDIRMINSQSIHQVTIPEEDMPSSSSADKNPIGDEDRVDELSRIKLVSSLKKERRRVPKIK